MPDAVGAQGASGDGDRCAGGDHVVDKQDTLRAAGGLRGELRPGASLLQRAAGLWRTRAACQQSPTRSPQLTRDRAGQQLGLVKTPLPPTVGRRWHPSDDIDIAGVDEGSHARREPADRAARVAVLQTGDELAASTLVGEYGDAAIDARGRRERGRPLQLERARTARCRTGPAAQRTCPRQQHEEICSERV